MGPSDRKLAVRDNASASRGHNSQTFPVNARWMSVIAARRASGPGSEITQMRARCGSAALARDAGERDWLPQRHRSRPGSCWRRGLSGSSPADQDHARCVTRISARPSGRDRCGRSESRRNAFPCPRNRKSRQVALPAPRVHRLARQPMARHDESHGVENAFINLLRP